MSSFRVFPPIFREGWRGYVATFTGTEADPKDVVLFEGVTETQMSRLVAMTPDGGAADLRWGTMPTSQWDSEAAQLLRWKTLEMEQAAQVRKTRTERDAFLAELRETGNV